MKMPIKLEELFSQKCSNPEVTAEEVKFKLQKMFDVRAAKGMEMIAMPRIRRFEPSYECSKAQQKILNQMSDEAVANTLYGFDVMNSVPYFKRVSDWIDK